MAVGAGGLISDLLFPGLDDKMARHITPNPSPLAQQGGPAQPGQVDSLGNPSPPQPPPGANLPPSASTQPDPVVAANTAKLLDTSYAGDALKYIRRDEMGQGINLGLDRIAAGFGTAQQQASKQQGIARGQGVGGGLARSRRHPEDAGPDHRRQRARPVHGQRSHVRGDAARPGHQRHRRASHRDHERRQGNDGAVHGAAAGNATLTGTIKDADAATRSLGQSAIRTRRRNRSTTTGRT